MSAWGPKGGAAKFAELHSAAGKRNKPLLIAAEADESSRHEKGRAFGPA